LISEPEDWSWNSTLMYHRQHHGSGNQQLEVEVTMHFPLTLGNSQEDFENWIYLTQSMQALCIKAETEHYRRSKSLPAMTMGAIYWQLNNIWQAPTWSGLEFGGRWKMLHYYVKNFFQQFLISAYEYPANSFNVHATSDSVNPVIGSFVMSIINWNGKASAPGSSLKIAVPALTSQNIFSAKLDSLLASQGCSRNDCFIHLYWLDKDTNGVVSENVFYPGNFTEIQLFNPNIQIFNQTLINSRQVDFTLSASYPAPYTFMSSCINGRFSDNGFCLVDPLNPNQNQRNYSFFGWEDFTLSQFNSCFSVKTLFDTYK